jgi:recombination protein RecT
MALQTLKNIRSTATVQSDFPAMLAKSKGELARALPRHISPDRCARAALTAYRVTPGLDGCEPRSILAAVLQAAQLGLEVGLSGEAHLVPFKGKCQLIPGYTGLMKLARNTGMVRDIYAHEVRVNDRFELKLGLDRELLHEPLTGPGGFPASDEERGPVAGFYAVAVFADGSRTFVAMSRKEVEKIRDGSRGYQSAKQHKKESAWDTDFVAMGLKTAIRRLCKFLPKSPELATALAMDAASEQGVEQNLDLGTVIDGGYAPVIDPAEVEEGREAAAPRKAVEPAVPKDASPAGAPALEAALIAVKNARSLDILDEIFIRAEPGLSGPDLDALKAAFKQREAELRAE